MFYLWGISTDSAVVWCTRPDQSDTDIEKHLCERVIDWYMKVWVALKDHLHHGYHQLLFLSVTLMQKNMSHLFQIIDWGDFKTQMRKWLRRCLKKVCVCERKIWQTDGLIRLSYGVSDTHPSPIQLITEKGQRDGERRKRQIIFAGMLTPTASARLISIPLAQTLQECYCVSVRGASSWWAAMPAWKRQFHIWSGNLLPLTKTQRLAPLCVMLLITIKYRNQTSRITKSNQLLSGYAVWPY